MSGWRRWWRFTLVGLVGIGVQLATLTMLVEGLLVGYQAATVVAVATAVLHNFVWHRRWTWEGLARQTPVAVLFARFVAANGLTSLFGNVVIMLALVGLCGVPVVPANIIAIGLCGTLNYLIADNLVFRPGRRRGS